MFIDKTKIYVKAGNGGDGAVAFHREKYVAAGGPDGGDGGKGGDVVFQVDTNLNTLEALRFKHKFIAQNGENGKGGKMYGKSASDLIIRVPHGTLIRDAESGLIIKDMSDFEPFILAKGGKGGWGNRHFATPTRQCPRFSKPGIIGESREVILELKLIADVGLVGFPNVGKSTLLSSVSAARPKIANYHFTTLDPNLGVVSLSDERSFVMADIPGIIEGASEGTGLGHAFLRHIERCRLLVHVVDISGIEGRNPIEDFEVINNELSQFSEKLASCPQIVVGNKCDIITDEEKTEEFRNFIVSKGYEYYEISAAAHIGTKELMDVLYEKIKELPPVVVYEEEIILEDENSYEGRSTEVEIKKLEDGFYSVEGDWLLRVMRCVNFDDYEQLQYFQRVLRRSGVIDKLVQAGVEQGDTVYIYNFEFDFVY
ncbi:MAG: GTPase CgtA [Clostridiales bacterium]|nr:MAG: GTPase CgtA [Clostridiales bacterium]